MIAASEVDYNVVAVMLMFEVSALAMIEIYVGQVRFHIKLQISSRYIDMLLMR